MKETKRRMELLSFYDHTGIAAHMEKMAAKGWMLDKIGAYLWHYRRTEPRQLSFAVSYYPKASQFDPGPSEGELTFHDFCEQTGWKLAASSAQLQVFYNERENPVPIETDPATEVDTLHRAARRGFLPAYFILLACSLLMGWLFIGQLLNDPIALLASPLSLFSGFAWVQLLLVCAVELTAYYRWRARAKKAAEHGEFLATPNTSKFQTAVLVLVMIGFAWWLVNFVRLGSIAWFLAAAMLLVPALLLSVLFGVRGLLKRRGAPKNLNRNVTFSVYFITAFVLFGAVIFLGVRTVTSGLLEFGENADHFLARDPPLSVADLMDINMDGYMTRHSGDESLLLGRYEVYQHVDWRQGQAPLGLPSMDYTVTEVKLSFLYDMCRETIYRGEMKYAEDFGYEYVESDPAPWGANQVWEKVYLDGSYCNRFLLCYNDRIVVIDFGWFPAPEQMAVVGEKLGG